MSSVKRALGRSADWLAQRRPAFWLAALTLLGVSVYLPWLGSFPLWDPWEPHYTQVAWEMQERHTWVNPWYRGLDNWWSKPILMLWMLRASLGLLWDATSDFLRHEWAARLPFALCAVAGGLVQYDWSRRLFGQAVGVLSAVILITAPQYLLIGRQVMVDTPFVVAYGGSLGYLAVGLFTPRGAGAAAASGWLGRCVAAWRRQWPFAMFWVLQALAHLAKGYVAQVLVVITLAGYALATFRWRDYQDLVAGRSWSRYLLRRGGLACLVLGAALVGAHFAPSHGRQHQVYAALVMGVGVCVAALGVLHDFPLSRHALHLLRRMGAAWGLPLFLCIAAPWFIYMSVEHGFPYWNEWLFYHHLGRAAGTIDKPGGTFDVFVRHGAFALFPWSAFGLGALWTFAGRSSPWRSVAERRNLFVLLATLLPYLFFSLSGTKFAHYIFPIVPTAALLIAATLVWWGREHPDEPELREAGPALGADVPPHSDDTPRRWWERSGARGDFLLFGALALIFFGIFCRDLVGDFRLFLRLFLYYHNRATPFDYHPHVELQLIFFPLGLVLGSLLLLRWIPRVHLVGLSAGALVLACYLGWVTLPAMQSTFSYKPFVEPYYAMAKPGEPLGQYVDWQQPERSVIFLFQNRCRHLKTDAQAQDFLRQPGRKFVIVDRQRLPALRRLAGEVGQKLHVVFDGHPYARLVSNEPNEQDTREAAKNILSALPPEAQPFNAQFDDIIRLVGYEVPGRPVRPGERVEIVLYYEALKVIERDWQIFIHGDGPSGGSHRVHGDHYPMNGAYPTTEWQPGEIIRDRFALNIPHNYPYNQLTLWNGWYRDEQRLPVMPGSPTDGENRVRGPTLRIARD